jgi:hypothetical protein
MEAIESESWSIIEGPITFVLAFAILRHWRRRVDFGECGTTHACVWTQPVQSRV